MIIVGFIRTAEGRAALDRAIEEARLRGESLLVVHSLKDDLDEIRAYQDELEAVEEKLAASGVEHEIKQYVRGNTPAEDLVQAADEEGADLVVIGIRRRSPVGKLLLGSNAQHVMLHSPAPVLAVYAPTPSTG